MGSIPKSTTELLIQKLTEALGGEEAGRRFSLHNGQVARMIIERRMHRDPVTADEQMDEYPRAYVDLDVPRAEAAIIAAVTALRGKPIKKEDMLDVGRKLLAMRWSDAALRTLGTDDPRPDEPPELEGATMSVTSGGYRLKFADELLQHYRADYAELSLAEQGRLVIRSSVRHTQTPLLSPLQSRGSRRTIVSPE